MTRTASKWHGTFHRHHPCTTTPFNPSLMKGRKMRSRRVPDRKKGALIGLFSYPCSFLLQPYLIHA